MSIFGLEPGQGSRVAIDRDLRRRVETWPFAGTFVYRGGADVVLRHGTYSQGAQLPEEYAAFAGAPSRCFMNALEATEANPAELRYCEGFYMVQGIATEHGWCLDARGRIVELTFPTDANPLYSHADTGMPILPPSHWAYKGVVIPTHVARSCEFLPSLGRSHPVDDVADGQAFVSPLLSRPYPWS